MNRRIISVFLKRLPTLIYLNFKTASIAKKNQKSEAEIYAFVQKYLKIFHRLARVNVLSYGLELLPKDLGGCLFMGNHQGRDDPITALQTLKDFPTTFVVDDAKSHQFFFGHVCDMMKAKRIKFTDLKEQVRIYDEISEEIVNGRRFIIFPEAGYLDNRNTLQEFHSPCFAPAYKTKCPVIPFCLYDSWKVYDKDIHGPISVQIHFLKPILYEEYASLTRKELAGLVRDRIAEKLAEIEAGSL